MFNTDPNRSIDEILLDIQRGAVATSSNRDLNLIGMVLAPFAALLVKLSRDADIAAQRMERLTHRLYIVTIALLVLTIFLFVVTLGLFAKEAYEFYEKNYLQHQSDSQPNQKRTTDSAPSVDWGD